MKKKFFLLFSLFIITLCLSSCKKGDNDPFLSLQSRKARLIGEWKVTNEVITASETYIDSNLSINSIYDGSKKMNYIITQTSSNNKSSKDSTYYSQTLSLKKDGTYEQSIIYLNGVNLKITEGAWEFLGKSEINKLKNKEAIYLTTTKTTIYNGIETNINDYSNLDGRTIMIDQLKNKKLILKVDNSFRNENTMISGKSITTTTYSPK